MKLIDIIHEKEKIAKEKYLEIESISYLVKNYFFSSPTEYYLALNQEFSEVDKLNELVDKYLFDLIPPQYILGYTYFLNNKIMVNSDVLIPRRETEEVTLKAISLLDDINKLNLNVLDIATGSGAIAIAIKKHFQDKMTDINVSASDISTKALEVAKKNAIINKVNIEFIESDLFSNISGKYDLIISNPPYLDLLDCLHAHPLVTSNEPISALYAPDDGLYFYKKIIDEAPKYLKDSKYLVFEIGEKQLDKIVNYALAIYPNIYYRGFLDMEGKNRILVFKF